MRVRVDQRGFVVIARAVNVFALLRTGTSVTAYQKFAMLFWFEGVLSKIDCYFGYYIGCFMRYSGTNKKTNYIIRQ